MTDFEGKTSTEIIEEINKRNRKFKFFAVCFMVVSAIALIVIVLVGLNNLQRANEQLKTQGKVLQAIKQNSDDRAQQLKELNNHIDCIATFFAQRNRDDAAIKNLDDCIITQGIEPGGIPSTLQSGQNNTKASNPSNKSKPEKKSNNTPNKSKPTQEQPAGIRSVPLVDGLLNFIGL